MHAQTAVLPMRIRILRAPPVGNIDGVDLSHFFVGGEYDVGHPLSALLVVEGWAEPLSGDGPQQPAPFGPDDPFTTSLLDRSNPPKLVKEQFPTEVPRHKVADLSRRRRGGR
jgi:hypothetical protein